ncbi:MAG: 50S ribosomal protein L20 [Microthrixaceae bacterium]
MPTETVEIKSATFRALWITRINAAVREHGLSYSVFMNSMKKAQYSTLIVKSMSELAVNRPRSNRSI